MKLTETFSGTVSFSQGEAAAFSLFNLSVEYIVRYVNINDMANAIERMQRLMLGFPFIKRNQCRKLPPKTV